MAVEVGARGAQPSARDQGAGVYGGVFRVLFLKTAAQAEVTKVIVVEVGNGFRRVVHCYAAISLAFMVVGGRGARREASKVDDNLHTRMHET